MRRGAGIRWVLATALATSIGAGCQSSPKPVTGGGMSAGQTGSEFRDAAPPPPAPAAPDRYAAAEPMPQLDPVYFDYDRFSIREDAKRTLRAHARAIEANPHWGVVTVEGHCDERGSEEYNLALGDQRADATRRYLLDLGVPSRRLLSVSFGESKPAANGHSESAWRYNRRSELKVGGRR